MPNSIVINMLPNRVEYESVVEDSRRPLAGDFGPMLAEYSGILSLFIYGPI